MFSALKSIVFACTFILPITLTHLVYANNYASYAEFESQVKELEKTAPQQVPALLDELKDDIDQYSLSDQIKYYLLSADFFNNRGNFTTANTLANKGLELAKQQMSPSVIISELLYSRGFALENLGDSKSAMRDYQRGTQLAESLNHKVYTAYGYINIGAMQYLARQYQDSLQTLNKARTIAEQADDPELLGYLYSELGILHSYINDLEASLNFYEMSFNNYVKAGQTVFASNARLNTASALMELDRYDEAIIVLKDVLGKYENEMSQRLAYYFYTRLATCYSEMEEPNYELAYQYLMTAGKYIQGTDAHDVPVFYLLERGELLHQLDRHAEVDEVLAQASEMIPSMSNVNQLYSNTHFYSLKARSLYKQEQFEDALANRKVLHQLMFDRYEKERQDEVDEMRMRFESEQADVVEQILQEQKAINNVALEKAKTLSQFHWRVALGTCVIALLVAWGFIKLVRKQEVLKHASVTDPLTGVANRYQLLREADKLIDTNTPFSVLILDIDHFKVVNDTLGHSVGDKVIQKVAQLGGDSMREKDTFVRLGGEEFVVLLPSVNLKQAQETAERLRILVSQFPWQEKLNTSPITISLGVADSTVVESNDIEEILKVADEKLYEAKSLGRNKVCS